MPQIARPIRLDLPELFKVELDHHLQRNPPTWSYDPIYFYYLANYLTMRQIGNKKDKEFFPINLKKLADVTIWNINLYIKYLVNGEFLERDHYEKGIKAFHYKLNPYFLKGIYPVLIDPGTKLYKKIIHEQKLKRSHYNRQDPHLKPMSNKLMKIDMDYKKAREWINTQPNESKKFIYHTSLTKIQDKRFRYFNRNKTNFRVDTNFTNLKSELRQYMVGDFTEIDLKNSQPFFFGILLKDISLYLTSSNGNTQGIPVCYGNIADNALQWFGKQQYNRLLKFRQNGVFSGNGEFLSYQNSVNSGALYDDFARQYGTGVITRDDAKKIIFKVFFSQNEIIRKHKRIIPFEHEKKVFASVYPTIYEIIVILKSKDHAKLSVFLQRMESKIFIDTLCPELVSRGIVPITIHDSIIVPSCRADEAYEICQDLFKAQFGIIPTFHQDSVGIE